MSDSGAADFNQQLHFFQVVYGPFALRCVVIPHFSVLVVVAKEFFLRGVVFHGCSLSLSWDSFAACEKESEEYGG